MKLLRTIRFDGSDEFVFDHAAGPDEWAISGAFAFADVDPADLKGKTRQAFSNGFLSLQSYGRSTFVTVGECDEGTREDLIAALARHLVERYGAPDESAAEAAAREEIGFAIDLCRDAPINTVLAVSRSFDEEGCIRETFRDVPPPGEAMHTRIWDVVD